MIDPVEYVTHKQLRELVIALLQGLWRGVAVPPLLVIGKPGIGKSQAIRELCVEMNISFIDLRLCQLDSCELRGLPMVSEGKTHWATPNIFPADGQGILFLDEITAADKTLQVAAYQLLMERELGEYRLPPGWLVIGAGNDRESKAVATTMSSALTNRFLIVELKPTLNDFLNYGEKRELHRTVQNFLKFRPKLLHCMEGDLQRPWPAPRSWERVSTMLKIAEETGNTKSLSYIVPGLVGIGAGTEFLAFYNAQTYDQQIRETLIAGKPLRLPEEADQAYAYTQAVITFIAGEKEPEIQFVMFNHFLSGSLEWSSDYAAMALNGIVKGVSRTPRRKKKLLSAELLPQWIAKHHLENASCLAVQK